MGAGTTRTTLVLLFCCAALAGCTDAPDDAEPAAALPTAASDGTSARTRVPALGDDATVDPRGAAEPEATPLPAASPEPAFVQCLTADGLGEPFEQGVGPRVATVTELREAEPSGPLCASGRLLYRGGSWLLCETLDLEAGRPNLGCHRWVVLVNFAAQVNPHTDPPTSIDAAAVGLAQTHPGYVERAGVVYSLHPQLVRVERLSDRRYALPQWPVAPVGDADRYLEQARALRAAAQLDGPLDLSSLELGNTVALGLGDDLRTALTADEMTERASWQHDVEHFQGWVGPFSALDLLATEHDVSFGFGRHDHCASPPWSIPVELQDLVQVHVEPTGIDSCLQWWSVDLFFDDEGELVAVTMNLWNP